MNVELSVSAGTFSTRLLGPPDLVAIQSLFEKCHDYFQISTGTVPQSDEAQRALVAGPAAKSVNDKRVVGVFDGQDSLVGLMDAIMGWPSEGCWTLGMLLLDPEVRGAGLGSAALAAFESWAKSLAAEKLRTALVSDHTRGLEFAGSKGFVEISRSTGVRLGSRTAEIIFLEKGL